MRLRFLTRPVASLVYVVVIAAPAYAVDGVVLINQAVALNGNVTPGDAPGFPVTISVPGSYRLTSNLTVPDVNTTAILVSANDVTIDLNGFAIIGPNLCAGNPASCSSSGAGVGIDAFGTENIKVFNGTVRGMGSHGVALFENSSVERVAAMGNGGTGISIASIGSVTQSRGDSNGGSGIFAESVSSSEAARNHLDGIVVTNGGSAVGNTTSNNGQRGIFAICPSLVLSNSAAFNSTGIETFGTCVRANNDPAP